MKSGWTEQLIDKTKEILCAGQVFAKKFKIAIAIPPNNDVDVFTNDVGLIAIIEIIN